MSKAGDLYGRPWAEREYIIVLNSYFMHRNEGHDASCAYIRELSETLGRTPGAIAMRMENYASIDPELANPRAGLRHMNAMGRRIFRHWKDKLPALKECADAFIRDIRSQNVPTLFDPSPIRIPKAFGRYELVDTIGEGGSGSVFSCVEINTQKLFALKIIKSELIYDTEALGRFRREIRALRSVDHPNVIKLHEDNLDSEREFPAFVMDYASCSLTNYLEEADRSDPGRNRPILGRDEAISMVSMACDAVTALHEHRSRIIHRDVNPNNILLSDGRWVVADFGLAKFLATAPASTSFRTTTRRGWGTMWYTAPEQYRNFGDVDERADVYSLGMLLWELFTSGHPPPDRNHSELSTTMHTVFFKATEREPSNRFATVRELHKNVIEAFGNA